MHLLTPRRLILLCFGLSLLGLVIRRLRAYRLKERHAILLLLTGLPFLVLAVWPNAVGRVSAWLDTDYRTISLMGVVAFFLLMVFELLTIVSLQDRKIAVLAQIVGIMMEKHGMSDRPVHRPGRADAPATPGTVMVGEPDATAPLAAAAVGVTVDPRRSDGR